MEEGLEVRAKLVGTLGQFPGRPGRPGRASSLGQRRVAGEQRFPSCV